MGVYRKRDKKHKYQKTKVLKINKKTHRKRRVNSVTFCTILASSGKHVEGYMLFYSMKLIFSSLSSSLGRAPSYYSFPSLTNFIDLGQI